MLTALKRRVVSLERDRTGNGFANFEELLKRVREQAQRRGTSIEEAAQLFVQDLTDQELERIVGNQVPPRGVQ